ncbi:phosphotransferase family protein [Aspergillus carlsbadensis]|nr:phosphotransferase family protein [Aspergillus carlsbadensis]
MSMDNGMNVIARIPHPIAGLRRYMTASEVATMDFARSVLDIPTPQVFAWSAGPSSPVQSEYIIMAEAPGVQLDGVWGDLSLEQKKMISVSFTRYGSFYYASETIPGATPVAIRGNVSVDLRDAATHRFCIGPSAERDWWNGERATMDTDRGLWDHPKGYALSVGQREIKWIQQYAVPKPDNDLLVPSKTQNSPGSHIALLQRYLQVAPYLLPSDSDVVASHIWHTDLHAGNIFIDIDTCRISSIIDWQGIWAAPLILQARHPRLVQYDGEMILKAPADFKDLDPGEKARIRDNMSRSIILYLYEQNIAKEVPILHKVLRLSNGRTRCEPILFAGDTWEDDIIPLRESLIRIERYWDEFGFDFPCPFHFTEDELRIHAEESDGWNEVQDLWDSISSTVARDGWTSNEGYQDAVALFKGLREAGLKTTQGKEREDFKKQT